MKIAKIGETEVMHTVDGQMILLPQAAVGDELTIVNEGEEPIVITMTPATGTTINLPAAPEVLPEGLTLYGKDLFFGMDDWEVVFSDATHETRRKGDMEVTI